MPIVSIQLLDGRTDEQVKELIQNVTDSVATTLNSPKENVRVLVTQLPKSHWGVAGVPKSESK